MVEDPARLRRALADEQLRARDITDERVIQAFLKVPREKFVRAEDAALAYGDHPLCIGLGQTISQPYIVALMTQCLELAGDERVLEIGTGSGYQAAILAEIARRVYTVERLEELSQRAQERLRRLAYSNIEFRVGDGTLGWEEEAPFDGIVVTAAAPRVPESLKQQLADGGRMVIPVGGQDVQQLMRVRRRGERFAEEPICECVFVKLIGAEGW